MIHLLVRRNIFKQFLYAPFNVQLVVTRRCNLACAYCHEFDHSSEPVPYETLIQRLEKLYELGTFSVTLTGGEPLLHPDIFNIVEYANRKFWGVWMITNGYLLKKESILALNHVGLDRMQLSLDSLVPNQSSVKAYTRLKNHLCLLEKYATFKIHINVVIGTDTTEHVLQLIRAVNKLGFKTTLAFIHNSKGEIQLHDEHITCFQAANTIRKASLWDLNTIFQQHFITYGKSPYKCRAGSRYLYIDEHGIVQLCSQQPNMLKKNLFDYTYTDLQQQFYRYKPCNATCSLPCVRDASTLDSWREQ